MIDMNTEIILDDCTEVVAELMDTLQQQGFKAGEDFILVQFADDNLPLAVNVINSEVLDNGHVYELLEELAV